MATLRRRRRRLKGRTVTYWVVDFSVTEGGKTRRRQQHFRVDPAEPQRARLLAEQRRAEIERKIARRRLRGEWGTPAEPVDVEVPDWLDAFARAVRPNCSSGYHRILVYTLQKFRNLLAESGILTTGQLRRQHFSDFVAAMQQKGNKPKTIHNDLSIIKRAAQWGIDEGWLEVGLTRAFPSVKVPKRQRRALSADEIEELLTAAGGTELYEPILVALYTGARRGELVQLRCSDVDSERGVIHFRAEITKSLTPGNIPVHQRLRPFIEGRAGKGDWLITRGGTEGRQWEPGALSRIFTALVRDRLGWTDVTFHCLRHTFGTRLAASGKLTAFEVQRLMRHRSISTSMRYVHLAREKLPDVDVF